MESLYQRLRTREFEILAVSLDTAGEKVVRSFVDEYALTFSVLLDPGNRISGLYALTGIPETFIIDKDGVILLKVIGFQDWTKREWLDYFDQAVGKTP
jgi:peroxiredoxin